MTERERAQRIVEARLEHARMHGYCKTTRGPHEVFQHLCHDPCHKARL